MSIFHFRQRQRMTEALNSEVRKRVFTAALNGAESIRRLANLETDPTEQKRLRKVALFYAKVANRERS